MSLPPRDRRESARHHTARTASSERGRAMVRLFGQELTKRELLRRVGNLDQVAGTRRLRFEEGPEDGVGAVEVRTGGGLRYTVLPSRALDISAAECEGLPIAWRTAV